MPKVLLPLVAALAVGGAAAGGGVYLATRGETVEEVSPPAVQQTATPTPTAAPTDTPTATAEPTAEPTETWKTYTDPGGLFTVRYPSDWFQSEGGFSSYDVSTLTTTRRPPEAMAVEVWYGEAVGLSGCGGALSLDSQTGAATQEAGATPTTLSGFPAWQIVRVQGDPAIAEEDLTRIQGISLIYNGYCVLVTGYFTQQDPDVATFEQIVDSFTFTK